MKKYSLILSAIIIFGLFMIVGGVSAESMSAEKSLLMVIHKSGNNYSVTDLGLQDVEFVYQTDYSEYAGRMHDGVVISFRGVKLGYFSARSFDLRKCVDRIGADSVSGGCTQIEEGDIKIGMPYFKNGKTVEFYDPQGKKVFTADISKYAQCNENGSCDMASENINNCPDDCREGNIAKDDGHKSSESWGWNIWLIIILAIIVILVIFAMLTLKRLRKKDA